jgi:hypothetical protein
MSVDIEKKSLEAHVELCAERYKSMDERFSNLGDRIEALDNKFEEKIGSVSRMLEKIDNDLTVANSSRDNRLIGWGVSIIGVLVTALAGLVWHMLSK